MSPGSTWKSRPGQSTTSGRLARRCRPAGPPRSAPGRRTARAGWTTAPPAASRPGRSRRRSGPRGCDGSGRPRRSPARPAPATSSTAPGPLPSAIARPIAWLPSCVTTRTSGRISLATRAISRLARSSSTTQTHRPGLEDAGHGQRLRRTAERRDGGDTPADDDRQLGLVGVLLQHGDRLAGAVQLLDDPQADAAQPADDHMPGRTGVALDLVDGSSGGHRTTSGSADSAADSVLLILRLTLRWIATDRR